MPEDPENPDERIPIRIVDRRSRNESRSAEETPVPDPAPQDPATLVKLEERARSAEGKLAEALNQLRRREAEAEDFRTRLRKEMERRTRSEMEGRLRELLDVLDSLDRGIASAVGNEDTALRQGLTLVRDQFLSTLARQGIEPMSLVGTPYDPHTAEAVAVMPADSPEKDGLVLEEIRRGYWLDRQVLRPAQVRVARQGTRAAESEENSPFSFTES